MKRIYLLMMASFMAFSMSFAQDASEEKEPLGWKKGGQGLVTFNQVGLYNWAAGGQSNMTLIGNLGLFANYKSENSHWDNSLDLSYGFLQNFYNNSPLRSKGPLAKAEDKIDLNSKYGKKAWNEKFYYTALLNFRTQFAPGFSTPGDVNYISNFMSPGYLVLAIGLDYKPNENLSIFLSPLAGKFTFVLDDSLAGVSAFGVNQFDADGEARPGSGFNFRAELGANFRMKYKRDIMENVGYETQLDLFSNYIDRPQNIDVRWTNNFVAKVNKYLAVTFLTDLIYDHDINIAAVNEEGEPVFSIDPNTGAPYMDANGNPIQQKGPRIQFKEVFGVGITYKF